MKKYFIIQNWQTEYPNLKTDVYGKPLIFTNIEDATANKEDTEKIIEINI